MNADLVVRLQAHAETLTTRVLDEMYLDPFWMLRFGERGRQFARQDGQFHLSYLIESLVAGDPEVVVRYARWLQSVLTTRGMCTRHIDENFDRLSRAIGETVPDSAAACEYLAWARRALTYEAAVPREIQAAAATSGASPARLFDGNQLPYLLSYLADAVALDRPDVFAEHVVWLVSTEARALAEPADVLEEVRALRDGDRLPPLSADANAAAARVLDHTLARVDAK
jgi:hypothetical protein